MTEFCIKSWLIGLAFGLAGFPPPVVEEGDE